MTVRRLVRISEWARPPVACLAALRRVLPRAELVCLSPGVWWIGEVQESTAARVAGQVRVAELRQRVAAGGPVRALSFWKAELQRQGFRLLALLSSPLPTPTQCLTAVAPCLRATPRTLERDWAAMVREADGTDRREASTKWLREEYAPHHGRDAHRHAYHRPIFSIPGA